MPGVSEILSEQAKVKLTYEEKKYACRLYTAISYGFSDEIDYKIAKSFWDKVNEVFKFV